MSWFNAIRSSKSSLKSFMDSSIILPTFNQIRWLNAIQPNVCKIKRNKYCRLYAVLLVYPDGSTITVRHPEPQSIIQLPLLLEDCKTDKERREWLSRRKRIEKVETEDDIELKYNQKQYLRVFMKKSMN